MTREEAIAVLENERPACGEKVTYSEGEICEAYEMAIEALRQPERPKGRWVNGTCTECGQVDFSKPNFCPECGADMRGEEE